MRIGETNFGRVAILVLDYDPNKEQNPSGAMTLAYKLLNDELIRKVGLSTRGLDVTVLANEELIAKHQGDFERSGLTFFPNWRDSNSGYRELLREGLRQGDKIYLTTGGYGNFEKINLDELEIINPEGKIDIRPKNPLYPLDSTPR